MSCSSTSPATAASWSVLASTTVTPQARATPPLRSSFALQPAHPFIAVLYDWRAGVALCQANAHMSDVHTCRFNPYSPGNEFVSVGNKHAKFWNGDTLEGANGLFGKVGTTQQVLCVAFLPSGQTLTGQLDGSVYVWEGGAIVSKIEKAHAHGVIGMIYCPLGIVTVGCDSQIKVRIRLSSSHAVPSRPHLASGLEPKVSRLHRRHRPEALRGGRPQAARPLPGLHTGGGYRGRRAAVVEHWQHGSRCARVFLAPFSRGE